MSWPDFPVYVISLEMCLRVCCKSDMPIREPSVLVVCRKCGSIRLFVEMMYFQCVTCTYDPVYLLSGSLSTICCLSRHKEKKLSMIRSIHIAYSSVFVSTWIRFYLFRVLRRNDCFVVLALFNDLSYSPVDGQISKVHLIKKKKPCSHSLNGQTFPTSHHQKFYPKLILYNIQII